MGSALCLFLVKLGPANHHFLLVFNVGWQDFFDRKNLGNPTLNGQHIKTKVGLKLGQLKEVIENNAGWSISTDLNNKANTLTIGFITDSCNTFYAFFLRQTDDMVMNLRFIDHVWKLSHNNPLTAIPKLFYLRPRTKGNRALASLIGPVNTRFPHDQGTSRKVGTRQDFHDISGRCFRVVNEQVDRIHCLTQVVRWDVGRHPDCDTSCTVHQ